MVSCLNPACRKTFTTPLKTLNLQQDSAETYDACPFCLTKIAEPPIDANNKPGKEQSKTREKPTGCQYHMGYLSEREKNQQIPDACMTCKDLLECMLRKMRINQ
jgi:hypothetical protein